MKKKIILLVGALAVLLAASCSGRADGGAREVPGMQERHPQNVQAALDEVNENANFPFPLALPEEELDATGYERVEGFGGYCLDKEGLQTTVAGWPDVLDSYHVMEYRFTAPEYSVLGFTVGDLREDAAAVLEQRGYQVLDSEYALHTVTYTKGDAVDIKLNFDRDTKVIYEIWVTAVTTNKDNAVF